MTVSASEDTIELDASGANSANTFTELLLQPLANVYRKPQIRGYAAAAYTQFSSGILDFEYAPERPGAYAVAVRFVNIQTGQETDLTPLGAVEVVAIP